MSFLSILKTIEEDVLKGIAVAAPIVGTFVPAAGPILVEVASIIQSLEGIGATPATHPPEVTSAVVQAVATVSAVKQHAASKVTMFMPAPYAIPAVHPAEGGAS